VIVDDCSMCGSDDIESSPTVLVEIGDKHICRECCYEWLEIIEGGEDNV